MAELNAELGVDLNVVIDKLHSFETAADLAEFFRGYGIVAQPRDASACAITKFVMEETGLPFVRTNSFAIRFYDAEEDYDGLELLKEFQHTKAMVQFVDNYDRGHYPDLIKPGYEINSTGVLTGNKWL